MERSLIIIQKEIIRLERFFPHYLRDQAERTLFALSVLFLSFTVLLGFAESSLFNQLWPVAEGLFLICFALLLTSILLEVYFHSLRLQLERQHEISFATLLVIGLHHPRHKDLAKAFTHSRLGKEVMMRLGIAEESIKHFLDRKEHVPLVPPLKGFFPELSGYLYDEDPYFRDFLERVHVSRELLLNTSHHVERRHHEKLSSRPFLNQLFEPTTLPLFSIEVTTRKEIEELEQFYRIIITEQATQQIVDFFREDLILYVSEEARVGLLAELIEYSLSAHKERFHGASIVLPADVRHFIIHKKSL